MIATRFLFLAEEPTLENTRADDKEKTSQDRKLISLSEPYEVRYWSKEFGTDEAGLRELVAKYGNSAANIRAKKLKT